MQDPKRFQGSMAQQGHGIDEADVREFHRYMI